MTPKDQFRASVATGVLIRYLNAMPLPDEERDAIWALIELVETAAEAGAVPPSIEANGPSKSGGGTACQENSR